MVNAPALLINVNVCGFKHHLFWMVQLVDSVAYTFGLLLNKTPQDNTSLLDAMVKAKHRVLKVSTRVHSPTYTLLSLCLFPPSCGMQKLNAVLLYPQSSLTITSCLQDYHIQVQCTVSCGLHQWTVIVYNCVSTSNMIMTAVRRERRFSKKLCSTSLYPESKLF